MRSFGLEIWDDEGKRTTFYTVRKDGAEENETDKFFARFEKDPGHVAQIQELVAFILDAIGDRYGAREEYFRFENAASALPPRPGAVSKISFRFENYPLRLYCLRLSEKLVILMNGGVKESRSAQASPGLSMKFKEANAFAKAITNALKEGELWISGNEREIKSSQDVLVVYF